MESSLSKVRLENGHSDTAQGKSLMTMTEIQKAPNAAAGSDNPFLGSLAGLANFVGIKDLRGLSNAFIKAFNVVKKVEYSALDTDLLWPRCYGDRVKSLLKESDDLANIAIKLHLQRCPLVGIGKIKEAMSKLVREFGIDHQQATRIGEQLDFQQFVVNSNEQIRRNIEDGLTTLHSRVLDTNVLYLYDYIIGPLSFHTGSRFEFVYIDPDYVEYLAQKESEKVYTHTNKLGLQLPSKRGISSVKEITWLRHTRLLAGTFTAVYHITKELPQATLNIRRGIAPSARCSLGLDESNSDNYPTAFFVQMGEWDIGLDSIGRALPFNENDDKKIKEALVQEVKKGTINRSTDQCRSIIERLINIEQRICTSNLFYGEIEPIIGRIYGEIIDTNRPNDTTVADWLKDIISRTSNQQKEIDERIMPDIREKFESQLVYV